jgi:hypothetical protein
MPNTINQWVAYLEALSTVKGEEEEYYNTGQNWSSPI